MDDRVKPTFKIVEQSDDFPWEEFKKDYCEMQLSKREIMNKYNLSTSRYGTRARRVSRETGFTRPQVYSPKREYIHRTANGNYCVMKTINGHQKRITVIDFHTARDCLKRLDEAGWSDTVLNQLRDEYGLKHGWKARGRINAPVKAEALSKYSEFKDLFFDVSLTIQDIIDTLGLSRHQYNVLRDQLRYEIPDLPNRNEIRSRT